MVKPGEFALARVSVLRPLASALQVPFMDDYIVAAEPVVDYVTRFSGIRPGDLDAATSPHHLASLKAVYLKLRYLADCGCVFLGHGLKKDFRIISTWSRHLLLLFLVFSDDTITCRLRC